MKYLTATEIAAQWEISTVSAREYCRKGRIPKVIQHDPDSLIPEEAEKSGIPLIEEIRTFSDYNGLAGRLILMKECLRHGIDLFIIDDKHRREFHQGIDM